MTDSNPEFQEFFRQATAIAEGPYPYQERLASEPHIPDLLNVPTGAGKTAAAVLQWLYRRSSQPDSTPRRLVYCLPMRVLVEQTHRECERWLKNLGLTGEVGLHLLMGGIDTERWFLYPEKPAILIGTQDMLLSRALNRGYAASRFHWPIDFGLLNNDCFWIFDEPQLMANGISTSAQLAGLRKSLQTCGECRSLWMSATLEPGWLDTIDHLERFDKTPRELESSDYGPKFPLHKRMTAMKILHVLGVSPTKEKDVATEVLAKHQPGTQTLVVVNTVDRAQKTFKAIETLLKRRKDANPPKLLLIHSRYRPVEREQLNDQLQEKGDSARDRIIVATQVVEAGVDISARTLITELAPWSSMVQRIGRCNRTGDDGPGQVFWIDLDGKQSLPYEEADLDFARAQLQKLEDQDVSPKALDAFKKQHNISLPFEHKHVLRRRDLLDLFDTTPDLSGNDIDIQRFIRSDDPDTDVQVFWREFAEDRPSPEEPRPERRELCSVPVGSLKAFLQKDKNRPHAFLWDHIDGEWRPVRDPNRELRPGLMILLPVRAGGYDWNDETTTGNGWDAASKATIKAWPPKEKQREEATDSDQNSEIAKELTITEHTKNVCDEMAALLQHVASIALSRSHLEHAARWHDAGKAHRAFQRAMRTANPSLADDQLWAKSGNTKRLKHGRRNFRHELASALAALQHGVPFQVAYLVAAHHGRVRLSIRALPDECEPQTADTLFALGVHDCDDLPEVDMGTEICPQTKIDLSPMQLGGDSSWTANALKLLGEIGPFKLAFLEALLRAADVRASRKEAGNE